MSFAAEEKYREDLEAHLWDADWAKYKSLPYSSLQSGRGFDDMDDYITGNILGEGKRSVAAMQSVSAEAYRFFLVSTQVMYKIGVAIELARLGYKLEKVG